MLKVWAKSNLFKCNYYLYQHMVSRFHIYTLQNVAMQPLVWSVPSTHTIERAYCLVKRCVEGGCFSTRVFQSPFPVETKKGLSEAVFSYSTDQRGVIKAAVAVALNKCTVQGPHWKEFLFIMYATRRAVATIVYSLCCEFFFIFSLFLSALSLFWGIKGGSAKVAGTTHASCGSGNLQRDTDEQ
jgi:hypothetical protein